MQDCQKTAITANPDDPPSGLKEAGKLRLVFKQAIHLKCQVVEDRAANQDEPPSGLKEAGKSRPVLMQAIHI